MVTQHGDHHEIPDHCQSHKPGGWLPADHRIHREWLQRKVDHVDAHGAKPLIPVLQELKELIEGNTRIYMYFCAMWEEVPLHRPCYRHDPTGKPQIRNYGHMLQVLNHVFSRAPEWTDAAANVGMVGVPLCAVFDYAMGTPSGHAAFLDPDVNRMLKKVLNAWGEFLKTPESAAVLGTNKEGWFGEVAHKDLMEVANAPRKTAYAFEEMFVCDPKAKNYGFKTWDDFFTRPVRASARPVAAPEDDSVVANACESKVYHIAHNVKLRDRFWAKGQPYSVLDMLANHPLADQFAGGTVYQAFLSALSYHRWHSPVSGTIRVAFVQDGTYFGEPLCAREDRRPHRNGNGKGGGGDDDAAVKVEIDRLGIADAQGYLTALATRAVICIEADNKAIGLMAFVGVGMDEVSTCEITVKEGQRVKKGDELGMFHFGGSSHCLLFRKGVKVEGFPEVGRAENVPVRGQVAVVKS